MKTKHTSSFKTGTPDLKYYAFDWDDNLVHMPTKIILLDVDGNEVPMSTEDFATFRGQIGKENFNQLIKRGCLRSKIRDSLF
jgi:hypothetical protein